MAVKWLLRQGVIRALPRGYDVDKHFKPTYDPWDQRLCGSWSGIALESGRKLEADAVVTATGLNFVFLGGMTVSVDGEDVDPAQAMPHKGRC